MNPKISRKGNEGTDNIVSSTNLKQVDLTTLWNKLKKTTPPPEMNQPSTTPNIKRMHDGWVFDTEIFDDEVEESEDKEQDYADK